MTSHIFQQTRLWQHALERQPDPDNAADARERLRNSFLRFRERAAVLAGEISRDLPDYTVHDVTHLDALWEMADLVAGRDLTLTPTEAFVFGGAVLLHDLGMSLAAHPQRLDDLRKEETWPDVVAAQFETHYGRLPTSIELENPPDEIRVEAVSLLLRNLHAKHAERLALIHWESQKGDDPQYLIDDTEIRQAFGRTIGLIAHSHWWAVNQLENHFPRVLGAPYWCPNTWVVDPLRIACLLRVADAAHIDARRAPTFLRATRKPRSYSDQHWKFQERLQKPHAADDALTYSSGYAFPLQDAESWWLCFDTLTMVDNELRLVDSLLADKGIQRLAVRRVAGIESPERLVSYIPTEGWLPVNAFVQVSDVPGLIKNLGGKELYGANPRIPLRELIQNAADAIRARRIMEERGSTWGEIHVRLGHDERGDWLEVEDNGIGMSSEVLRHYLLDFGSTYWGSGLMLSELPGLFSRGMRATGKYGIGFFSIFMLGGSVQIRTRRFDAAQNETLILEFNTGLSSRPILRAGAKDERIRDGGTCVRVWLDQSIAESRLLNSFNWQLGFTRDKQISLSEVCRRLAPSLDVNLITDHEGEIRRVISSSDWLEAKGTDFFYRFVELHPNYQDQAASDQFYSRAAENLRTLVNEDGEKVGRACILSDTDNKVPDALGVITVGGLFSCGVRGVVGILVGKSERAIRDLAKPLVSPDVLSAWASEQAELVPRVYTEIADQVSCAEIIRECGGDTRQLPIATFRNKWVSYRDLADAKDLPHELILVASYAVHEKRVESVVENAILVSSFSRSGLGLLSLNFSHLSFLHADSFHIWPENRSSQHADLLQSLAGAVIEAVSNAWGVSVERVLVASKIKDRESRVIGTRDGIEVAEDIYLLRRPI